MKITEAIKYMPDIEKVCKMESRRFFCNADETINTISIYSMKKQIPMKPKVINKPIREKFHWFCGACGAFERTSARSNYCPYCGQRVDWSEYLKTQAFTVSEGIMEESNKIFPELDEEEF